MTRAAFVSQTQVDICVRSTLQPEEVKTQTMQFFSFIGPARVEHANDSGTAKSPHACVF